MSAVPSELHRLNRQSLANARTPHGAIDWSQNTTEDEFESLYDAWSLLFGTGLDHSMDDRARSTFVKYQQINLMTFTALLERYGIASLSGLYDIEPSRDYCEYLGHFIKEEIYHYTMFVRAVDAIEVAQADAKKLPTAHVAFAIRWIFRLLSIMPGRKTRTTGAFLLFRFAEEVSIQAHMTVRRHIARPESLVRQVWGYHALEEARHLAFDTMVIERHRPGPLLAWLPRAIVALSSGLLSLLINANEVWAARQLGVRVGYWQLPWLLAKTQAPFKRQAFRLLRAVVREKGTQRETSRE